MAAWNRSWVVLMLMFGLLGPGIAGAQVGPNEKAKKREGNAGARWAVIIGVNQYLDPKILKLKYAVPDAEMMADKLVERCGYEPDRVLVLTDDQVKPHLRPLRINLEEQMVAWLEQAKPGDTVLIFFAGHGFLDDRGQTYLAPQDCRLDRIGLTGLRTEEVRNMLQECKATQKLLVLDCCHAGNAKGGAAAGPGGQELAAAFKDAAGLITLASCGKAEQSLESNERGHGLFTYFLAEGLGGAGDYDRDGIVDSDELYRYVWERVPAAARKELNAQQTPVRLIDAAAGVFALARLGGPMLTRPRRPTAPGRIPSTVANGIPQLSERCEIPISNHTAPIAIAPDGKTLAIVGENHVITLYNAATGEEGEMLKDSNPKGRGNASGSLMFSPDGRRLAFFDESNRGGVRLWDWKARRLLPDQAPLLPKEFPYSFMTGVFVTDRLLASSTLSADFASGSVKLWDSSTGRIRGLTENDVGKQGNALWTLAVAPDGKTIAAGYDDGAMKLWDVATGALIRKSETAHSARVSILLYSPDGDVLASVQNDGQAVKLWDARTLQRKGSLNHKETVKSVAFCPGGKTILTGGQVIGGGDGEQLKLWDVPQRVKLGGRAVTETPVDSVCSILFAADGKTVATQNYTTKTGLLSLDVRVWDYDPARTSAE